MRFGLIVASVSLALLLGGCMTERAGPNVDRTPLALAAVRQSWYKPISGAVGQFVPGLNEALKLMRPGDEWVVWIPPTLGYGAQAAGPIPANSTLRFHMALRSVATP